MMESVRALMTSLIDYAGLFPPAALSMQAAVREYAAHRGGGFDWALGRFVVPASALGEFEEAARACRIDGAPWRLSALAGPDLSADVARILGFNNRAGADGQTWAARVDAVETKLDSPADVQRAAAAVPGGLALYVEAPGGDARRDVIAALREADARAKMRTGGASAGFFPASEEVAHFLDDCSSLAVPFKMTAGLHHLLRGSYPLTREPGSEEVWMHGYLNVFLAAAFLDSGMDSDTGTRLLEETSPEAFRFDEDRIAWRDYWVSTATLADARRDFALSFGSCSFDEPIEELKAGGILEP